MNIHYELQTKKEKIMLAELAAANAADAVIKSFVSNGKSSEH